MAFGPADHEDASAADFGTPETGSDAAPDPVCPGYCQCLADTCATQAGYPFATPGSCMAKCQDMSAAEPALNGSSPVRLETRWRGRHRDFAL